MLETSGILLKLAFDLTVEQTFFFMCEGFGDRKKHFWGLAILAWKWTTLGGNRAVLVLQDLSMELHGIRCIIDIFRKVVLLCDSTEAGGNEIYYVRIEKAHQDGRWADVVNVTLSVT